MEEEYAIMLSEGILNDDVEMVKQAIYDSNVYDEELLTEYLMMAAGLGRIQALKYIITFMVNDGHNVEYSDIAEQGILIGSLPVVKTAFDKYVEYFGEEPGDDWNDIYNMARTSGWIHISKWLEGPNVKNIRLQRSQRR